MRIDREERRARRLHGLRYGSPRPRREDESRRRIGSSTLKASEEILSGSTHSASPVSLALLPAPIFRPGVVTPTSLPRPAPPTTSLTSSPTTSGYSMASHGHKR